MPLKRCLLGRAVAVALASLCACKKERPPPPPPSVPVETPKPPDPATVAPDAGAARAEVAVDDPDESPLAWSIYSGDGKSKLKQKPGAPGKCWLECTGADGASVWSATGACFGEKSDRKFLANDCVRTVVMIPAPLRSKSWRQAEVMRVYKKDKLDYPVVGIAAMKDEKLMKGSRSWLKGCYGLPGDPPQYSSDGSAVEYESIDGKKSSVPLVAK